jgi:hypothetical protein
LRDKNAEARAERGDEETFRQHLANEAPARGPKRTADGKLLGAQGGTAELHIHHVHTRDQQDEDDRTEHGVNGSAKLWSDERIQQRLHVGRGQLLICFRVVGCDPFRQASEFRVHLVERHTFFQPAHDGGSSALGPGVVARFDGKFIVKRHPEFLGLRKFEALRHHADDGRRFPVNPDRLADDARIAAEIALPDVVAEDRRLFRARFIVVRREIAADDRRHPDDAEEILGDVTAGITLGIILVGDVDRRAIQVTRH